MSVDAFGIHIGFLYVRYYALLLIAGAFLATTVAALEAQRRGDDPNHAWDGMLWVLIAGIVGARVWHILTPPPSMVEQGITTAWYLSHPLDAINTTKGGLGIPGAIAGGVLGLWLFCRRRRLNLLHWMDIAAPGVPLAQAVGRWGNFINQELYGRPTDLPWAIHIDPVYRLSGFEQYETYHPIFLYESIWNLGAGLTLMWVARRWGARLRAGELFLLYLVLYPLGRFLVEFIRLDSAEIGTFNANQTLMLVVALVSAAVLTLRRWRPTRSTPPSAA